MTAAEQRARAQRIDRTRAEQRARNARVDAMVELFRAGHSLDYVCEQGLAGGWTRDDVLTLVRQRGWPLDSNRRLPLSMQTRPARPRPGQRRPPVGVVPIQPLGGVLGAIADWAQSGRTHPAIAVDQPAAENANEPASDVQSRPDIGRGVAPQTPTEGTAPAPIAADAAGTAPDPTGTGHGYAGPDAQPQVSPSRSRRHGKGRGPGASDAPAGPPPDLLAIGLAHPNPVVRAHAKRVARAIDDLCTALSRAGRAS